MNIKEKEQFVNDLCSNVAKEVISKINKMPEDWNGHELRVLLAHKFEAAACHSLTRGQKRAFNNAFIVRNL